MLTLYNISLAYNLLYILPAYIIRIGMPFAMLKTTLQPIIGTLFANSKTDARKLSTAYPQVINTYICTVYNFYTVCIVFKHS